jgi:Rrf2 family protein
MLRVSSRGEYGSRLLVHLARRWGGDAVTLNEVAVAEGISLEYLEQLVAPLRRAGLVESQRGAHGGYKLSRAPEDIRMGEALRVLEGPIAPMVCVAEGALEASCALESHCSTRVLWARVGKAIADTLDSTTLADLIPVPAQRQVVPPAPQFVSLSIHKGEKEAVAHVAR